jgi:hypothetical protein
MKTDSEILSYLEASHGTLTLYYCGDPEYCWVVGLKGTPPEQRVTKPTLREAVSAYMELKEVPLRRSLI